MFFYTQTKLFPWHMAQARRAALLPIEIFWETYWATWFEVYR